MIALEQIPLITGEIADYRYDTAGILYSYSKNPKRTIENISRNIALVKQITGNKKVPLLIYLCDSPAPDKKTRKYSTEQLPNMYTAMAMVSKPGLAQIIMKLLFRFQKPPIPMRSFTDDGEAREWLKQFL
ncbi:MAG: STAS/SEC14 domain-containing protein [bacterium]|nr:STAS/SEC14 domain-containing protein [bacterium]